MFEASLLQVVAQALIQGKNLILTDNDVLATRADGSPLTASFSLSKANLGCTAGKACHIVHHPRFHSLIQILAGEQGFRRSSDPEERLPFFCQAS